MPVRFLALETATVRTLQDGGPDANGQRPETQISDGDGVPCRHCLAMIEEGAPYLVLAHRPFPGPQPYAEVGPIFLHAQPCKQGGGTAAIPAVLYSPQYIIRGYDKNDRIVYGTGKVTDTADIPQAAEALFDNPRVAYVHVRSASNNCYHCRIERG